MSWRSILWGVVLGVSGACHSPPAPVSSVDMKGTSSDVEQPQTVPVMMDMASISEDLSGSSLADDGLSQDAHMHPDLSLEEPNISSKDKKKVRASASEQALLKIIGEPSQHFIDPLTSNTPLPPHVPKPADPFSQPLSPGSGGIIAPKKTTKTIKARVSSKLLEVSEECDEIQLKREMRRRSSLYKLCYTKGLNKNPTIKGEVELKWAVDPSSLRATQVELVNFDVPEDVATCVKKSFMRMSYKGDNDWEGCQASAQVLLKSVEL